MVELPTPTTTLPNDKQNYQETLLEKLSPESQPKSAFVIQVGNG